MDGLVCGLEAMKKSVFFSTSPEIVALALLIIWLPIKVRLNMRGNNMKNITPIETGKTIVGILPDITSDDDVAAKETM